MPRSCFSFTHDCRKNETLFRGRFQPIFTIVFVVPSCEGLAPSPPRRFVPNSTPILSEVGRRLTKLGQLRRDQFNFDRLWVGFGQCFGSDSVVAPPGARLDSGRPDLTPFKRHGSGDKLEDDGYVLFCLSILEKHRKKNNHKDNKRTRRSQEHNKNNRWGSRCLSWAAS